MRTFYSALVRMLDGERRLLDVAVFMSLIKEFERSGACPKAFPSCCASVQASFREADGRMFNEYGSGHTVIDTNAAMSQLPFKPTMTQG